MSESVFMERYRRLDPSFRKVARLPKALRVNTLRIAEADLVKRLTAKGVMLTKVPFLKYGYTYESRFSLGSTPEYLLGYYYLQEAASQVPVQVLNPRPSEMVLDMACAPGSKLTQCAQWMQDKGVLIGIDANVSRLRSAANNVERLGIGNTALFHLDSARVSELKMDFDKVLLDAPCSGNYCIEPGYFQKKTIKGIKGRSSLQRSLLEAGFSVLKKGGTLVYSTCSLEPEECELVVDWALRECGGISIVETGLSVGDPGIIDVFGERLTEKVALSRRFWPHRHGTQGFFVAKFIKK
ncbi:MAG: RsmB/NOP family class I SAM-dependent RNA methyltransferase [Nanoarchaeota archaeon]